MQGTRIADRVSTIPERRHGHVFSPDDYCTRILCWVSSPYGESKSSPEYCMSCKVMVVLNKADKISQLL